MKNQKEVQVIGILDVQRRIIPVRGIQVMLDRDLGRRMALKLES